MFRCGVAGLDDDEPEPPLTELGLLGGIGGTLDFKCGLLIGAGEWPAAAGVDDDETTDDEDEEAEDAADVPDAADDAGGYCCDIG